jgi:hypothetical protein
MSAGLKYLTRRFREVFNESAESSVPPLWNYSTGRFPGLAQIATVLLIERRETLTC